MPQGNCVKHIRLNKTLYRIDDCPHCKIILLERLLAEEQEDSQLQRKIKNANWERAVKAESEVFRLKEALTADVKRLKTESDQILNDAIANIDRKAARITTFRALLEESKQFAQRIDGDGDPLHIDLARRIHRALAESV